MSHLLPTPESEQEAIDQQDLITKIATALYKRFNREPTQDEVYGFIVGTDEERRDIWNFGVPKKEIENV